MENNKHHIDQYLREQMEKLSVEMNEAHWKDAERRLDEDDKKKRPFVIFFIAAVLLIGLGTSAVKKLSNNKKTKQEFVQGQQTSEQNKSENVFQQTKFKETAQTDVADADQITDPQKVITNNITTGSNAQPVVRTNTTVNSTKSMNNTNTVNSYTTNTASISGNTRNSSTGGRNIQASNSNTNGANTRGIIQNTQNTIANNTSARNTASKTPPSNKPALTANSNIKDKLPITTTGEDDKLQAKGNPEKHTKRVVGSDKIAGSVALTKVIESGDSKLRIYRTPEEYQKMNPRYVDGLETYVYTRSTLTAEKSDSLRELLKKQNASVAEKKMPPPSKSVYEQKPSSFFLMAGLAAAKGYSGSGDGGTDYGLSPSLGIGYQLNFTDRMSLYLSMYMSYINHLNIKETGTNVTYSFDKDSSFVSVTRKNLLQLQIPLHLAYKIKPKHTVFGGLGINLGLNSVSLYEDSKQSSSTKQFGYMNGIRFMDVNASIGYEYQMSTRFSLGLFYQQGFFDMTKNNYFNNQLIDNNARGGINLRYKFLR